MSSSLSKIFLFPTIVLCVGLVPSQKKQDGFFAEYPEHLPGAFTGGFGEQTCHSCHFDYPINFEEGVLSVEGFPERYQAEKSYRLQITVERRDLGKAGFQLSARFAGGSQAGSFKSLSDRTECTTMDSTNVQYIQHSAKSVEPADSNKNHWAIEWTAPESSKEVLFNLAANAANGDASAFGDFILSDTLSIPPSPK